MHRFLITGAAGLLTLLPTITFAFQNEPTGFRGIPWGTPFSAVQAQMSPFGPNYERIGDSMTIGGATLEHIVYEFHNGGFSEAFMTAKRGIGNAAALIAAFRAQFGEGVKTNQFLDDYIWQGPIAIISLSCKPITHDCDASVHSSAAWNQKQAEKAAAAARSKRDF